MNEQDTEVLEHRARARGHRVADFRRDAEVYVLNSCTVTHQADKEARRLARAAKRRRPDALVVVTGCYAEVDAARLEAIPEIDLVVGNLAKPRLFELLEAHARGEELPAEARAPVHTQRALEVPLLAESHRTVRPNLKVQDGCDRYCTFCIVPRARGRSRSSPPARVLEQLRTWAGAGIQEAVLTGVHLASYGRDLRPGSSLDELLGRIAALESSPRLRISSVEPVDLEPASVELLADRPERFCRHLHMALQSGSDRVLAAMRRSYRREAFLERAHHALERIPGLAVGLDVLVGFPGEDDEDFAATRAVVEELPVAYLHVFPYSRREGTPAARREDQVPAAVSRDRLRELVALGEEKRRSFLASQRGRPLEAVAVQRRAPAPGEDPPPGGRWLQCLSDNYVEVHVPDTGEVRAGDLAEVELEEPDPTRPRGRLRRVLRRGPEGPLAV